MPQRQLPSPHPPIAGLVQGFIYPTNQPPVRELARQQPPATPATPIQGVTVAGTTETYLFNIAQPGLNRRSYRLGTKVSVHTGKIRDVTADTVMTYPFIPPDRAVMDTYTLRGRQTLVNLPPLGLAPPVTVAEYIVPSPTPPIFGPVLRAQTAPRVPIEGAAVAPLPADVFLIGILPDGAYAWYRQRPKPVLTIRGIRGPAVPVQNPTAIHAQPVLGWWARLGPSPVTTVLISTGATTQPTFLYPPNQPELRGWSLIRLAQFTTPPARLENPIAQPTYIFSTEEPSRSAWYVDRIAARLAGSPKNLDTTFAPATPPQTYLFPLLQPSRTAWYIAQPASAQPEQELQVSGAPFVATAPIPAIISQPSIHWWKPWEIWMAHEVARVEDTLVTGVYVRRTMFGEGGSRRMPPKARW